ncbi:MAG: response regulator [Candidatus Omnitrophica bacterium]|nr:response regulator [Candidatus Omnitrophota bacterium]MCA9446975.1 response regulator [Candidatus Omnitrophota bacterium]
MIDKPRVLVADDEERILILLQANLEAFGFEVRTAEDGHQALGLLENERFDAVITDMNMPGAGGMEIIQFVRREFGPSLPVIVITAYGSVQNAVHAMQAGATDYLEKPFDMGDLRKCLAKWIEAVSVSDPFNDN